MGCQAVTFDYNAWVARYPEFAAVQSATAQEYFNEAGLYFANPNPRVSTTAILSTLLNMVTAHIASLYSQSQNDPTPGQPKDANTPVGRINSATQGSVTIQTQNDYPPGSPQWWQQSKYGASFWAASAQYRTGAYVPGATQYGSGGLFGIGGGFGFGPGWGGG